jgi:hypothetical protein
LGTLFLSFVSDTLGSSRKLVPVTSGKPGKSAKWRVKVHTKPVQLAKGYLTTWKQTKQEIRKIELYRPDIPIEETMSNIISFYEPKRRLIAAQLDLNGHRQSWINPGLLADEDFQGLVQAQEQLHNGCSPKQKAFYQKLTKLYLVDLGLSPEEPDLVFQEIAAFRKGVNVWV